MFYSVTFNTGIIINTTTAVALEQRSFTLTTVDEIFTTGH